MALETAYVGLFARTNCCSCRLRNTNSACIPVTDTMTVSQLPVTWVTTEPQIPTHSNSFHLAGADSNIRNTRGTTETCCLFALSYVSLSTSEDYPVFLYSCLCPQHSILMLIIINWEGWCTHTHTHTHTHTPSSV